MIETAKRHRLRGEHAGLGELAGLDVGGLRQRVAAEFQDAYAAGNETLLNFVAALKSDRGRVVADLSAMGRWDTDCG